MSDEPDHPFLRELARQLERPLSGPHRFVIAISGGADSTALACGVAQLLEQQKERLCLAHFDHRWRDESATDARFVSELARKLGVHSVLGSASDSDLESDPVDGKEAQARSLRYAFLKRVAAETSARYVMTAHTLDDQAETVLFRFARGSGLHGLAGIRTVTQWEPATTLLRPMLNLRRAEVIDFLKHAQQEYREDPTNQSTEFSRNRIRHELLPLLNEIMGRDTQPQIASTARQMDSWSRWIDDCLTTQQQNLIRRTEDQKVELEASSLRELPTIVAAELLRRLWRQMGWPEQSMTAIHWEKLATFCRGDSSAHTRSEDYPGRIYADRSDGQLWLIRKVDASRDG